jgi:hypothetical protein
MAADEPLWETVYTVSSVYERPLSGVADFEGEPHGFEAEFDRSRDEYTDRYQLRQLSRPLFDLLMDQWQLFEAWRVEYQAGRVERRTHPVLPKDRERYRELNEAIEKWAHGLSSPPIVRIARFRRPERALTGRPPFEVSWREAD